MVVFSCKFVEVFATEHLRGLSFHTLTNEELVNLMQGPKAGQQGIVDIFDVFVTDAVDSEIFSESLADELVENLAGFFEPLDDGIGADFVLIVEERLILID